MERVLLLQTYLKHDGFPNTEKRGESLTAHSYSAITLGIVIIMAREELLNLRIVYLVMSEKYS